MLLSLQQAILIRPERPWMEAFAALLGGALLVLVGGIEVQNVHIVQDFKVNQIGSRQCNESKMLCMNKKATMAVVDWNSEAFRFIKEEVAFYTTLIHGYVCIRKTKFTLGKHKAISACSIPITGLPSMWPTFWLGPSMARLLVGPREEQNCSK